jgi:hypothetical protein
MKDQKKRRGSSAVDPRTDRERISNEKSHSRRHPAFGSMKDVTRIAPGSDLTEPAMPEWADMIDEKYGKGS